MSQATLCQSRTRRHTLPHQGQRSDQITPARPKRSHYVSHANPTRGSSCKQSTPPACRTSKYHQRTPRDEPRQPRPTTAISSTTAQTAAWHYAPGLATVMETTGNKLKESGHITSLRIIPMGITSTTGPATKSHLTRTSLPPFLCYCSAYSVSWISHPHIQADSNTDLTARTQVKHHKRPTWTVL